MAVVARVRDGDRGGRSGAGSDGCGRNAGSGGTGTAGQYRRRRSSGCASVDIDDRGKESGGDDGGATTARDGGRG